MPEFQTGVESPGAPRFAFRAWPNPFAEHVEFRLDGVAVPRDATVEIFDSAGRRVSQAAVNTAVTSGALSASWNGHLAPSGVYFARVQAGVFHETIRVVLLK